MQLSRKNHYLPQFYLAQWCTPEPKGTERKLWSHWIAPSGKPCRKRKTTAEVGYARHGALVGAWLPLLISGYDAEGG